MQAKTIIVVVAAMLLAGGAVQADVLNMGGVRDPMTGAWTGLASLETVTVGDPCNVGELSGAGAGGYGPDRICGAVGYTYRIGTYEVTAAQYAEFLNDVARADPYGLYDPNMWSASDGCKIQRYGTSGNFTYTVGAEWSNRPVNYVSWGDAARFANWLTNGQPSGGLASGTTEDGSYALNGATRNDDLLAVKRNANARYVVPTEDEWYKAAYYDPSKPGGAGYWDYPTGTDAQPGNSLTEPDCGNTMNYYTSNKFTLGGPYYRTNVGEFENSSSPYGTFDQGGNIYEWCQSDVTGVRPIIRGGSYQLGIFDVRALDRSNELLPWTYGDFIGFRIAELLQLGDCNHDGKVTDADYTVWADNFGATNATWDIGDFNGDKVITDADYTVWADNYGYGVTGTVPEPASIALLAFGVVGMLKRRRGLRR